MTIFFCFKSFDFNLCREIWLEIFFTYLEMHFKQVIPKKHSHCQHPQQLHFFKKQTDLILLSRNQQEDCLVLFIMASI